MDVRLIYEGTDITDYVNVTKCVCRDVSCGRADSLELEFDHAAVWYKWGPKENDKIIVELDGYSTGIMFLNAVVPRGESFTVLATALPSAARRKTWDTYRDLTLEAIMRRCAIEAGMTAKLYGTDGRMKYTFLMRENEGVAAFLDWLGKLEGLAIKAANGAFRAVSIEYAQSLNAVQTMYIDTKQQGVTYTRQELNKISKLTIASPYARVSATDSGATYGNSSTITTLPIMDVVQAGRWARGLLLSRNRQAESLTIKSAFNPAMVALTRVDIEGTTDANGEWIVDDVEHDLVNLESNTKMLRVMSTIR